MHTGDNTKFRMCHIVYVQGITVCNKFLQRLDMKPEDLHMFRKICNIPAFKDKILEKSADDGDHGYILED